MAKHGAFAIATSFILTFSKDILPHSFFYSIFARIMADSLAHTGDSETVSDGMRKPNAEGVPERKWFIAIVKQNTEERCCKQIGLLGHEAYVASQQETRIYANRHRRTVSRVVIPGVVFVRATEEERIQILKTCPLVPAFLTNKAGRLNEYGRRPMAVVPDSQMETLRFMLYHADAPVCFTSDRIRQGDRIRVVRGPFAGLEGHAADDASRTELVVNIDFLGVAKTVISVEDIERVC